MGPKFVAMFALAGAGCSFHSGGDGVARDGALSNDGPFDAPPDVPPPDVHFIRAQVSTTSGDYLTRTVTLPDSAGDLLVVVIGWNSSLGDVAMVRDTASNAYVRAIPKASSGTLISQTVFYAYNVAAAAANTITVTFSQSTHDPDVRVFEYDGIRSNGDPLDATVSTAQAVGPFESGPLVTTYPSALVVGAITTHQFVVTPGAGFTSRGITVFGDLTEDMVVAVAATYHATATLDADGDTVTQAASFKAR